MYRQSEASVPRVTSSPAVSTRSCTQRLTLSGIAMAVPTDRQPANATATEFMDPVFIRWYPQYKSRVAASPD